MPPTPAAPEWPAAWAALTGWYSENARSFPFRKGREPWGVLVSEVMGQQTPMARVVPRWIEWMERWPTPAALAAADEADVLRAWDRLGYPRRALNLRRAAQVIVASHGGRVPRDAGALQSLPGIGEYTASAVVAFAFRGRTTVLDTNTRRVLARLHGEERPGAAITRGERERAEAALPPDPGTSATWNEALMELGALVCTPDPDCTRCPLREMCAWSLAGRPVSAGPARRTQSWHGSDRQVRGRIMARLRGADVAWVPVHAVLDGVGSGDDPAQPERALAALAADRLVTVDDGMVALGGEQGPRPARLS